MTTEALQSILVIAEQSRNWENACALIAKLAKEALSQPTPLAPWTRAMAQMWRDDAFEKAAQFVERYFDPDIAEDPARDIRAMMSGPAPTVCPDGWKPIETAPKDGSEIILFHREAGVCAGFCPGEGFAWHVMDGQNTYVGRKSGKSLPSLTSFVEPPTHWMPLPQPPANAAAPPFQKAEGDG